MSKELWVFKYSPKTLDEMVVSDEKRQLLQKIIDETPNTLLVGKPGTGKGTFMDIMLNETNCNYLKINASINNSIDDIRNKVHKFASAFDPDKKKIVYLNEADRISSNGMDALKDLIESVQHITRFFFLSNDESLRNDPEGAIKSRCSYQLNLNDPPGKLIMTRCVSILKQENIKIENKSAIVDLIKKCYPDIRKIIGTLQSNVVDGKISNISFSTTQDIFDDIFNKMKTEDIEGLRKTLRSNYIDYGELYNYLYKQIIDDPDKVQNPGEFIILIGEALYRDAICAISEVNFMAMFFNMMKQGVL